MLGASVKGYSLKPEKESLFNQVKKDLKCKTVFADIRDRKKLEKELLSFEPDFVFHLAAQSLVRPSYQIPIDTFEINAIGTANILDAIRKLKKSCAAVIITTDKVYENNESGKAFLESDPLGGYDPYSASKACAEIVTSSFTNSFFNLKGYKSHKKAIATARAGNVIGGGDYSKDRLIPDIYKALKEDVSVKIRSPKSVRPWQYVLEPLSGYMQLAALMAQEPQKYSSAYNFGPEPRDILDVETIVKSAIKAFGKGNYKIEELKNMPHEAKLLSLNISKAKSNLGWKPMLNSKQAITKTMLWYKNALVKNTNIFELCKKDIHDFTNN
jgi:CDP-glucose 4,6-dehydratase